MAIDLDLVPVREKGMSAYEILLSESQERMLLVVKKGFEDKIIEILSTRKDFALIISDILMPVMDGFKFSHEVKSNPELSSIPFVFLTGSYISDEDKIFGIRL